VPRVKYAMDYRPVNSFSMSYASRKVIFAGAWPVIKLESIASEKVIKAAWSSGHVTAVLYDWLTPSLTFFTDNVTFTSASTITPIYVCNHIPLFTILIPMGLKGGIYALTLLSHFQFMDTFRSKN